MGETEEVQIALAQNPSRCFAPNLRAFWISVTILCLCFARVFYDLVVHVLDVNLHSHIILVPFISGYLLWQLRPELPAPVRGGGILPVLFAVAGLVTLGIFMGLRSNGKAISQNDYLSFQVFAFCMFLFAIVTYFLGWRFVRTAIFPIAFLLVLVPLPDVVVHHLEIASQYASAETYSWMMDLSGATYYREGRTFVLPSLTIVVAQECSGIRSSLVLFITSLIAAHLFLRTKWKKIALCLAVFPLGIVRNAFRIYFLSMASAHWNPEIIHSPLHHRGGPIFFALSLIPFFLFLFWLKKSERQKPALSPAQS